ncbi:MAG: radical SAM protein [Eubacteriales bacterium]|nr:radical SAM protein [Eubacteriales bacterium]
MERIQVTHPCFDQEAHRKYGRIHLPVAPKCNIQCRYCDRKYDCANESRPGVTSRVLKPEEAVSWMEEETAGKDFYRIVGIAGPGEPLANEETFETLELLKRKNCGLQACLSTNGLLLPQSVSRLAELGVSYLTVTMNGVCPEKTAEIYRYVRWDGRTFHGREAAELLLGNQMEGIRMAVAKKMIVKVNMVVVPGINEDQAVPLARTLKGLGVRLMNANSVIPAGEFRDKKPLPHGELCRIRNEAVAWMPQFTLCRQCRADAAGIPGKAVD